MSDQDPEEQFEQEPVESEQDESLSEQPVLSAPKTVRREAPAPVDDIESIPEGPAWYVIHCYSGYENKVRHNLEQRIETMGMKDRVFDVVVPTQEEIEVRDGKRRTVERHIFPGYVLVNMALSEESWFVVRNTPGVTGFVGMGNLPTPLCPRSSDSSRSPPSDMRMYFLPRALAMDLPNEVFPTPGGPTRHRIGDFRSFFSFMTARYSTILSFTFSRP